MREADGDRRHTFAAADGLFVQRPQQHADRLGDRRGSAQVDVGFAYYDSTLYAGPNLASSDLRATPDAWATAMRGKDIYVLDLFESYMGAHDAHIDRVPEELEKLLDEDARH